MTFKECIEKINTQVTKEWEAFQKQYGQSWDDLNADGQAACLKLIERQSLRFRSEMQKRNFATSWNNARVV